MSTSGAIMIDERSNDPISRTAILREVVHPSVKTVRASFKTKPRPKAVRYVHSSNRTDLYIH